MEALPLSGQTVLDLTLARAGPTAVRHLADWGANVIRIEPPASPDTAPDENRDSPDFQNLHRNKRMVALDLKSPDGYEAFLSLVRDADIVVENMRVSVKRRLRIAWEDLHPINPRLVYGSISGFGQTGPYSERPALDQIAQGMSGLMSITGQSGVGPMRVGIDVADLTAGNLLAFAIMTALFERERTGKGRWVHTSLLESMMFMLDFQAARYLATGDVPAQAGNDHPIHIPAGVFRTRDGHITIAASSPRLWPRFCRALRRDDWLTNAEWASLVGRSLAREAINAAIERVLATQDGAFWIDRLSEAGIPCGPILTIADAFEDPQVQHLAMAQTVAHPRLGNIPLIASPINIEPFPRSVGPAAREHGEDTREITAPLLD